MVTLTALLLSNGYFGGFCSLLTTLTGLNSGSQREFLRDCVPVEGEWMREKGERERIFQGELRNRPKKV